MYMRWKRPTGNCMDNFDDAKIWGIKEVIMGKI
jgi:hypothetical protein